MSENIFFDLSRLKSCGQNVVIGKTVRIRYPEIVEIADNVIIDDFTYISTQLKIGSYVHIAAGCKIIGGKDSYVEFGEFSTLSSNVVLAAGSDDFVGGLATPLVPAKYKGDVDTGSIIIGRHSIVGANSVVLPNVTFHDGASLGALSLAKRDLKSWYLYAGVPARKIRARDNDQIEKLEQEFREMEWNL